MKNLSFISMILCFSAVLGYAGETKMEIPLTKTLRGGEELKVRIDNSKIKRIVISIHNVIDDESIVFRSEYVGGKERAENEIGPKKYRTFSLKPKITDENVTIKRDRKTIVLDTSKTDEIYLKVEKGKVDIDIREEKKRM